MKATAIKLYFLCSLLSIQVTQAQKPFITIWKTDNPGSSNDTQITIPTNDRFTYDYTVSWEKTTAPTINGSGAYTGNAIIDFPEKGTYRISITGEFPHIFFNDTEDKEKILSIEQWGDIEWKSMKNAFEGCKNMNFGKIDAPNLSLVTDMSNMFHLAIAFNGEIGHWDVSNVTDMNRMFANAWGFNQYIGKWNVSKVTNMKALFFKSGIKNQGISNWDVSSVTNMRLMFSNTYNFNEDISVWDVSNVTDMGFMFFISSFNQNIGGWNIGKVRYMTNMFTGSALSPQNYDKILAGWAGLQLQSNVYLGTDASYCQSQAAREKLINTFQWKIIDAGKSCQSDAHILTFVLEEQIESAIILDATDHTVHIEVSNGTNLTTLVPAITVSEGATVSPESGTETDFTNPVVYTVTAEDGTMQEWTVMVTITGSEQVLGAVDEVISYQVFPNPFTQNIYVKTQEKASVSVLDLLGREIIARRPGSTYFEFDMSTFPKGIYVVFINDGQQTVRHKVVKTD